MLPPASSTHGGPQPNLLFSGTSTDRFRVLIRVGPECRGWFLLSEEFRNYFDEPKLYTRLVVNRLSMCLVPGTMFEL